MGVIYTLGDILEGRVPSEDDFDAAYRISRKHILQLVKQGRVYGGLFYGSTRQGGLNPNSDIDILLVSYSESIFDVMCELNQLILEIQERTYVKVQIKPHFVKEEAEYGIHPIRRFFKEYLKTCDNPENIVGNNPLELCKETYSTTMEREIWQETQYKLLQLYRERTNPDYDDKKYCLFLQHVLMNPIFTAFNMLQLKNGLPTRPDGTLVSKREICERYCEDFGDPVSTKKIHSTLRLYEEYNRLLKDANEFQGLEEKYVRSLIDIDAHKETSRRFLLTNLEILKEILNGGTTT